MTADQLTELLDIDVETYAEMTADTWCESNDVDDLYPITFWYRRWHCYVFLRRGDAGVIGWDAHRECEKGSAMATIRRSEILHPPYTVLAACREAIAAIDELHGGDA